jgi:hypothetical protein
MSATRFFCTPSPKFVLIASTFHAYSSKSHKPFSEPKSFPIRLFAWLLGSFAFSCFCIFISGCNAYIQKDSVKTFSTSAQTTTTCGETGQSSTDGGNALWQLGTPCATGTNSGGYTVSSISYWVGTPTSASFDLGVYSNSSASPSSLLCTVSTGTITPSSGWNSVKISSCPTLSASTTYWVGYITGSNQIEQGTVSGTCPGTSDHSNWSKSALSSVSLGSPFPANAPDSDCYSLYLTLSPATGASQSAGSGEAIGVNATSLSFGGVALSQLATQPLTLTNSGTSAGSVSAVTVTGAGFSIAGSTFPITLNAGQAATLNIQFDPTAAGAASGTLTIFGSSTSTTVAQVSLSGTGVASEIDLTWNAPASSSPPLAGYNIYRSNGTSSFERLNSTVDKQTTYQDGSLQVGGTYEYYVTTVNSSGMESSPSNTTTVSVP